MNVPALMIEAQHLSELAFPPDRPLAFVDLAAAPDWKETPCLPPYPVIGLGDGNHPYAQYLDIIVEAPVTAEALARQIIAQAHAAAVTVQLLRTLPGQTPAHGLIAESLAYATLQGSEEHRRWIRNRASETAVQPVGRVRVTRIDADLMIELDRAEQGNAIDRTIRDALYEAFSLASIDPEIDRVILTGCGRSFSLGADLAEFGTTTDPAIAHAIRSQTLPAHMIQRCAAKLEVRIQGACVGAGLEMAAWAKSISAAPDAWFQLPELAMGVLPGAGGCVSLTRRIGRQRAGLMILSGKRITAKTALDWGLIDTIVDEFPGDNGGAHIA